MGINIIDRNAVIPLRGFTRGRTHVECGEGSGYIKITCFAENGERVTIQFDEPFLKDLHNFERVMQETGFITATKSA